MNILINVNGTVYSLPLTGESIGIKSPRVSIRCVGIDNPQDRGVLRRDFQKSRQDRILFLVPSAPSFITINDIANIVQDASYQTVRRSLLALEAQGKVVGIEVGPKSYGNGGRNPRRWMRVV